MFQKHILFDNCFCSDAYMRDYAVVVPNDCTAANTKGEKDNALQLMHDVLKANICTAAELEWDKVSIYQLI